jgi:dsDNA-specific endonuclease/ATPase MutS2
MNNFDKSMKTLEYDKILKILSALAATEGAAEEILNLVPSDDIVTVNRLLDETSAAVGMVTLKGAPPFGRAKNIVPAVDRAQKAAVLTPRELLDIASMLRSVAALKKYAVSRNSQAVLDVYFDTLTENSSLEKKISLRHRGRGYHFHTRFRQAVSDTEGYQEMQTASRTAAFFRRCLLEFLQENIVTMRPDAMLFRSSGYRNEVRTYSRHLRLRRRPCL